MWYTYLSTDSHSWQSSSSRKVWASHCGDSVVEIARPETPRSVCVSRRKSVNVAYWCRERSASAYISPVSLILISVNLIWSSSCVFRFRRTVTSKGLWCLPLMCHELNTNEKKLHSTVWFRPRMCTCAVELVHCCAMDSLSNFSSCINFYFVHCLSHAKGHHKYCLAPRASL